jgi:hypothetical protein
MHCGNDMAMTKDNKRIMQVIENMMTYPGHDLLFISAVLMLFIFGHHGALAWTFTSLFMIRIKDRNCIGICIIRPNNNVVDQNGPLHKLHATEIEFNTIKTTCRDTEGAKLPPQVVFDGLLMQLLSNKDMGEMKAYNSYILHLH